MKKNSALSNARQSSIAFVAGKSGGHLIPALTLAQEHKKKDPNIKIFFFTTNTELDYIITQQYSFVTHIPLQLPASYSGWHVFRALFSLIYISIYCSYLFVKHKITLVSSTGGFISIPVTLAAYCTRTPIHLYELNAIPGKATRFIARIATHIYVSFKSALRYFPAKKSSYKPYPVQFAYKKSWAKTDAYNHFGFENNKITIMIVGGSQGSLFLNTTIKKWIASTPSLQPYIQLIHQTGHLETEDLQAFYTYHGISSCVFTYTHVLGACYTIADIIIGRAGAGTLFEALYFKIPLITIPLENVADDHQLLNSQECAHIAPELVTVIRQQEIEKSISVFSHHILLKLLTRAQRNITFPANLPALLQSQIQNS